MAHPSTTEPPQGDETSRYQIPIPMANASAHAHLVRVLNSLWLGDDLANSETQLIDALRQACADVGPPWTPPASEGPRIALKPSTLTYLPHLPT